MRALHGWAYLVGAGPGDPGLITVRGLELVRTCDVLAYDRLVAPELVAEASGALRLAVGKVPFGPAVPQERINGAVISHARAGDAVVRLKGGDPFVFGRGGEEASALVAAGVPFEVVPGVTAATAVPAYAGIPLTHRGLAGSFVVLTAHDAQSLPPARWEHIAAVADTIVLMMGVRSLDRATGALIEAGLAGSLPAAIVEWGTTDRQRTITGTVATIAELARRADVGPPATTIIGRVVQLRDTLEWFGASLVEAVTA